LAIETTQVGLHEGALGHTELPLAALEGGVHRHVTASRLRATRQHRDHQAVDLRGMQEPTAVPRLELRARDDPGGERREGAPGRGPRALDLSPQRHLAGRSEALDTIDLEQVLCDRVGFSAAQGSGRSRRCPRGHPSNRR